jgi:hypothetical protein
MNALEATKLYTSKERFLPGRCSGSSRILSTLKAEIRRIVVQNGLVIKLDAIFKITSAKKGWRCSSSGGAPA